MTIRKQDLSQREKEVAIQTKEVIDCPLTSF